MHGRNFLILDIIHKIDMTFYAKYHRKWIYRCIMNKQLASRAQYMGENLKSQLLRKHSYECVSMTCLSISRVTEPQGKLFIPRVADLQGSWNTTV